MSSSNLATLNDATELYQGFMAGFHYNDDGGGANFMRHENATTPSGASSANNGGALMRLRTLGQPMQMKIRTWADSVPACRVSADVHSGVASCSNGHQLGTWARHVDKAQHEKASSCASSRSARRTPCGHKR